MLNRVIRSLRNRVTFIAIALCLASAGLLITPKPASAFEDTRSCACSNLEACPYQYQRMYCDWSGGSMQCGCSFYVTNCIEDE